jgi:hypothetical protein
MNSIEGAPRGRPQENRCDLGRKWLRRGRAVDTVEAKLFTFEVQADVRRDQERSHGDGRVDLDVLRVEPVSGCSGDIYRRTHVQLDHFVAHGQGRDRDD